MFKLLCRENVLEMNVGRYKNIPQELHMCPLCKSCEEDENHFLWSCSAFSGIRMDLLICDYRYVSIPKFIDLAYNDRTLMLLGAPSVELEPKTQLRLLCDSARIISYMYDLRLSHVA